MEALAADPQTASDAYLVGSEGTGETWSCRVSAACVSGPTVAKAAEFGLVAMRRVPGNRTAYLLRAYDSLRRSNRVVLRIVGTSGTVASLDLGPPLTLDNFEGLAVVPHGDGSVRFYLISDDNGISRQRTLLLAFDWTPHTAH